MCKCANKLERSGGLPESRPTPQPGKLGFQPNLRAHALHHSAVSSLSPSCRGSSASTGLTFGADDALWGAGWVGVLYTTRCLIPSLGSTHSTPVTPPTPAGPPPNVCKYCRIPSPGRVGAGRRWGQDHPCFTSRSLLWALSPSDSFCPAVG